MSASRLYDEDFYAWARRISRKETGLPIPQFPALGPWSYEQLIDEGLWPDAG